MEEIELDCLDYDAVVLGTGVCESMLAGALARAGKKVLVLEGNDYYGSSASTLPLDAFLALLRASEPYPGPSTATDGDTSTVTLNDATTPRAHGVYDGEIAYVLEPSEPTEGAEDNGSVLEKRRVRQFSADLHPTLFFARSPMVRLLARSGVSRYLEFRAVTGCEMLATGDAAPRVVPNSKAALFADRRLALPEKRMLMRFLQQHAFLAAPENQETSQIVPRDPGAAVPAPDATTASTTVATPSDEDDCTLDEYVRERSGVTSDLVRQLLVYGIALADDGAHTPARAGMDALALYARSIGAYGPNTPFLALLYGTAEVPQAFSRAAAVYGADCILRQHTTFVESRVATVDAPSSEKEQEQQPDQKQYPLTIRCETVKGGVVHAAHVVVPACRVAAGGAALEETCWQRALVVTRTPVLHSAELACLVVAPGGACGNEAAVRAMQCDPPCRLTPRGCYATVFAMRGTRDARPQLRAVVEHLVRVPSKDDKEDDDDTRPTALLCTYHTQVCRNVPTTSSSSGTVVTPDVCASTDFGDLPATVERLFRQICGEDAEFFPPMPDPEDLSWNPPEGAPASDAPASDAPTSEADAKQ